MPDVPDARQGPFGAVHGRVLEGAAAGADLRRPLRRRRIDDTAAGDLVEKPDVAPGDVGIPFELLGKGATAQVAGRDLRHHERVAAECAGARLTRRSRQTVQPRLHHRRRRDGYGHGQAGERGAERVARQGAEGL